jgi:ribosome-binding protein aMBF1 (putative translation factor)
MKSNSEAFKDIREKVQKQMKKQNVSYQDIINSNEEDEPLEFMDDIQNIIDKTIKEQNLSEQDLKESLEQSLREVRLMREGKLPKKTAREVLEELRNITKTIPILKVKDGMIELDPDNPHHKEWFEEFKK